MNINYLTLSGCVRNISKTEKGVYYDLYQKVSGKLDLMIKVLAPTKAIPEELDVMENDDVLLVNALFYMTADGPTARICSKTQLQLINRNFDQGDISADEAFK